VELYTSEINTIDNGSVVFGILLNLADRFLVTVNVVAVAVLGVVYFGCYIIPTARLVNCRECHK
jgi:hypothetical protein